MDKNREEKYNLNFLEAIDELLKDNCWIKGENFKNGVVLYYDRQLNGVYSKDFSPEISLQNRISPLVISKNLSLQKFRKIFTEKEINI